jgi:hypothetical protein
MIKPTGVTAITIETGKTQAVSHINGARMTNDGETRMTITDRMSGKEMLAIAMNMATGERQEATITRIGTAKVIAATLATGTTITTATGTQDMASQPV